MPLIIKGPGIQPGSRVEGNVYLLDVLATLCDLAGSPAPETNEGLSFKPVLQGKQKVIRDVLYGVHCGGTKPGMRCVKQGDWKLIKYDGNEGLVRETQLFNLAENPYELVQQHHDPQIVALTGIRPEKQQVNLAGNPRYAQKLAEMEDLLHALHGRACAGTHRTALLCNNVSPSSLDSPTGASGSTSTNRHSAGAKAVRAIIFWGICNCSAPPGLARWGNLGGPFP